VSSPTDDGGCTCALETYGTHQTEEDGCGLAPQAPRDLYDVPLAHWTAKQKEVYAHVVTDW
jgi:hypothetical protein